MSEAAQNDCRADIAGSESKVFTKIEENHSYVEVPQSF